MPTSILRAVVLFSFATVACSPSATSGAPTPPSAPSAAHDVACDGASTPAAYHVEIEDDDGTKVMDLANAPLRALVAADKSGSILALTLNAKSCGDHTQLAYSLTRLELHGNSSGTTAMLADLGPPPGVKESPFGARDAIDDGARVEGIVDVVRGKESWLARGIWRDGRHYAVRVTAR